MENEICPKCNRKSLYFRSFYGTWRCSKCKSYFDKQKVFLGIDDQYQNNPENTAMEELIERIDSWNKPLPSSIREEKRINRIEFDNQEDYYRALSADQSYRESQILDIMQIFLKKTLFEVKKIAQSLLEKEKKQMKYGKND